MSRERLQGAEPAHTLEADGLSLAYDGREVIGDLDLTIPDGDVTVIVGANACGKSTLLRGIARLLRPSAGIVRLDDRQISTYPAKEFARVVGILPQSPIAPDGITVADLVGRGRHPHQGLFRSWSSADGAIVADAMAATSTTELAGRRVGELSGGQRQRVWVAMALAQDTDILLLDEPTTFLDVTHQIELLDLLAELNHTRKKTIVMVLHDLNLAARYAHHLVVMAHGEVVATGAPADVLTPELVQRAFGLESHIIPDPVCGTPMVIPIGRFHRPAPISY
ncbi:ABC transporter ATP-binding protein [Mycetocola manganoxydans]|uniref:ABC transporter ATP-binding protein n=1 Tax=Mycetocola manganoxydans TaxID=699879 RepID=A0A3L6ZWY8_9MICO|nr:ABC transporter ATP-binding protein [Mycetocola manganoxydans]RLP72543.1 ABC transporter ATP-binding protein [Mycetocola manganoxydans]GHD39803.1 ABC transporter ATP-binding protein [Mycetocola manganoxydans]